MENINIVINKATRMIQKISKKVIGNEGENLQENLVFSFDDQFVNGTARLEIIKPDDTKSYIMLTKNGETYQIPVRSVMTKAGKIYLQLVITEGTSEEDIPIFKSNTFYIIVNDSINAEIEEPDEYAEWIDIANAKLNEIDEALSNVGDAITETNNLDLDVSKTGKVATVTLTKKDATTKTITLSDGTSLQFQWDGTRLGIKTDEDEEYTYVDLQGIQGPVGPKGEAFTIKKTYSSVAEMNADFNNMQLGDYVMIASTVEVEDNAKLYTRGESQWIFISDFSGAQGIRGETGLTPNIQIGNVVSGDNPSVTRTGTNENPILNFTLVKGDKGDTGNTGPTGATGNGIASITKTSTSGLVDTYTITYTNGTTTTFEVTNGEDGEVTETELNVVRTDVDDLRRNQLMNTETGTNINVDDAFDTRIMESKMSKESTQETTKGVQLFNKNASINGGYLNDNNVFVSNQSYGHSDYISVNEGNYYLSGLDSGAGYSPAYCYYDENKSFIEGHRNENFTAKLFNIPSNVKYIRFSFQLIDIDTIQLEEGSTATPYEPYTGGQASPNPSYPQDVKTVKGYRNLFNFNTSNYLDNGNITITGTANDFNISSTDTYGVRAICIGLINYSTLYRYMSSSYVNSSITLMVTNSSNYNSWSDYSSDRTTLTNNWSSNTYDLSNYQNKYLWVQLRGSLGSDYSSVNYKNFILSKDNIECYVPYGTNWVYTKITNGTDTNYYTIPLNNNEIVGIGDYKDELIIDKNGHCWLNKKVDKMTFDGTENWTIPGTNPEYMCYITDVRFYNIQNPNPNNVNYGLCTHFKTNYIIGSNTNMGIRYTNQSINSVITAREENMRTVEQFKQLLSANNMVLYGVLLESELIDLNYTVDIRLFNGVNNISNSDDMDMTIKYVQDLQMIIGNIVNTIGD